MRTIPFFRASTPLTPAERLAKRHLVFKDTLALLSIFAVTCVLAVLTWLIFRSYSQHQSDAAARWKRRGEDALRHNNATAAVYDLRTASGLWAGRSLDRSGAGPGAGDAGHAAQPAGGGGLPEYALGEGAGQREHQSATGARAGAAGAGGERSGALPRGDLRRLERPWRSARAAGAAGDGAIPDLAGALQRCARRTADRGRQRYFHTH